MFPMSAVHRTSPLPSSLPSNPCITVPVQSQLLPNGGSGRIVFTRQLWQRTMPDDKTSEARNVTKSPSQDPRPTHNDETTTDPSRVPANVSTRSLEPHRHSHSPSQSSKTPFTPEQSPPFRITRKRNAALVEEEDRELESPSSIPANKRSNSGDSTAHVCICQPNPKIPRPRNAFILYRQHHQANVVAQNPGLANPEISKIIGEQWQKQPVDVKNKWKGLAEEEKLRHQQQYPTYRYQPKRHGRRNSITAEFPGSTSEKPKCTKCGGRSILAPTTPFTSSQVNGVSPASVPPTPGSGTTPTSRTLPVLRDLSLQSPASRRTISQCQSSNMSPNHNAQIDERDDLGPLSPYSKRRRLNGEHPPTITRAIPPRYSNAMGAAGVGPGTPIPWTHDHPQPHPYPLAAAHTHRESLPGLRGVVSSPVATPMAPPPRPGMGYQQHRLSQGHISNDRSLTLPPLQTGNVNGPSNGGAALGSGRSAEEHIMSMSFRYKVKVLSQVAQPAPNTKDTPRGPLVVVEGDDSDAVKEISTWLSEYLKNSDDLSVRLLEGPDVRESGDTLKPMVQYHRLAAEWLLKSDEILDTLSSKHSATPVDSVIAESGLLKEDILLKDRQIDEEHDKDDDNMKLGATTQEDSDKTVRTRSNSDLNENMDVDKTPGTLKSVPLTLSSSSGRKPAGIIANYSLHASNVFACRIPISANDNYSPSDHWQWTATQWRGIIGPDLTIFLRDSLVGESGKPTVEMVEEGNLFVVKRTKCAGKEGLELEPTVLRRLGFEVCEWVRAFDCPKSAVF